MRVGLHLLVVVGVVAGLGPYRSIHAAHIGTVRVYTEDFALRIPADSAASVGLMNDAIIEVSDHITVADLDVSLVIRHECVFDLVLVLLSPAGTRVVLNEYDPLTQYFTGQDYLGTVFDDEASISIQAGVAPFNGRFRPLELLTAFDGEDACGLWRLQVRDAFAGDVGMLEELSLTITTATVAAPAPGGAALLVVGCGLLAALRRRL
jgi:subtilisin-like proprotein convertase family protein